MVKFIEPIEGGVGDASTSLTGLDPTSIEAVDTVTDCLDTSNEYFYISYSDSIARLDIENSGEVTKETIDFNETILDTGNTDLGEIVVFRYQFYKLYNII